MSVESAASSRIRRTFSKDFNNANQDTMRAKLKNQSDVPVVVTEDMVSPSKSKDNQKHHRESTKTTSWDARSLER